MEFRPLYIYILIGHRGAVYLSIFFLFLKSDTSFCSIFKFIVIFILLSKIY